MSLAFCLTHFVECCKYLGTIVIDVFVHGEIGGEREDPSYCVLRFPIKVSWEASFEFN